MEGLYPAGLRVGLVGRLSIWIRTRYGLEKNENVSDAFSGFFSELEEGFEINLE